MSRLAAAAHRLIDTISGATRMFSGTDRTESAIAAQERTADKVRLDSRLPL
jgi:hypothetical protein